MVTSIVVTSAGISASRRTRVETEIVLSARGLREAQWLEDRRAELLDVPYFHVVFTVPDLITSSIAFQNQTVVYDILFGRRTLRTIAADPEHLGARDRLPPCTAHLGTKLVAEPSLLIPGIINSCIFQ